MTAARSIHSGGVLVVSTFIARTVGKGLSSGRLTRRSLCG